MKADARMAGFIYAPNHYDCTSLPGDSRCKVILSKHQPKTLVVFVHGFRGDAVETWRNFDELAITSEKFREADLVFFGYDGYLSNVLACSSFLFDLLNDIEASREPITGKREPLLKARAAGYGRIVLVAHSLGAVVSRWAMLRAAEECRTWREKVKILLFAPAHTGSDLASLASAVSGGFAWITAFVEGAKAGVPLLRELDSGSRILSELAERVTRAKDPCLRASRVVVAEREIVVNNLPFPGDPCPDALRDTDHISVCKPATARSRAISFLEELLA